MIVSLNSKTRIPGTEMCWQLEKLRKREDRFVWQPFKYFTTLGHALAAAGGREIRTAPIQDLAEAIKFVDNLSTRYDRIIEQPLADLSTQTPLRLVS